MVKRSKKINKRFLWGGKELVFYFYFFFCRHLCLKFCRLVFRRSSIFFCGYGEGNPLGSNPADHGILSFPPPLSSPPCPLFSSPWIVVESYFLSFTESCVKMCSLCRTPKIFNQVKYLNPFYLSYFPSRSLSFSPPRAPPDSTGVVVLGCKKMRDDNERA